MSYQQYRLSIMENSGDTSMVVVSTDSSITDATKQALTTAINAVTLGTCVRNTISSNLQLPALIKTGQPPSTAQRGEKVLIKGKASVANDLLQRTHKIEIPTFDKSLIGAAGSDVVPYASGATASLKTALEAVWRNDGGFPILVQSMQYVNRRLN